MSSIPHQCGAPGMALPRNGDPVLHLVDVALAVIWSPINGGLERFAETVAGALDVTDGFLALKVDRFSFPNLYPECRPSRGVLWIFDIDDYVGSIGQSAVRHDAIPKIAGR